MKNPDTVRLSELPTGAPTPFLLEPEASARAALADRFGIPGIRKLRFQGELRPSGKRDWELRAKLGATVVQSCVVTLAPVTTRIDEDIARRYLADCQVPDEPGEIEMPEDETVEPLPETLDLAAVMAEALALALPPFPRAEGASLEEHAFTEPGKTPMTDDDARPFAGLAGLRDKLSDDDDPS